MIHSSCFKRLGSVFLNLLFSTALLVLPMTAVQAAPADLQPPSSVPMTLIESSLTANDISSEKVSQFVQAYLQVVALIDQRENDLQSAETESESLRIQQEIQTEAFSLITQAGLTQTEYWQLLGLANSDMEFRERILAQLEEAIG